MPVPGVALRKESVDRNPGSIGADGKLHSVALRKESVDRNAHRWAAWYCLSGRSPQGERG